MIQQAAGLSDSLIASGSGGFVVVGLADVGCDGVVVSGAAGPVPLVAASVTAVCVSLNVSWCEST